MTAIIDDTYAEAFRSVYTEFLITATRPQMARTMRSMQSREMHQARSCAIVKPVWIAMWDRAATILSFETPDGRPGAIVQLHVPRFWKDRVKKLEKSALVRISQKCSDLPYGTLFLD